MDSAHHSKVGGLSIWVGLAAFFSSSSDRTRAHEMLAQAREERKSHRGESGEGNGNKYSPKEAVKRLSMALGLSKKAEGDTEVRVDDLE